MEPQIKDNQFKELEWPIQSQKDLRKVRVIIGHLTIENYRTFKPFPKGKCLIMYKSHSKATQYLYFKLIQHLTMETIQQIATSIKYIDNFIQRKQNNIRIILYHTKETSYWEINENTIQTIKLVQGMSFCQAMSLNQAKKVCLIYEGLECEMRQCGASEFARVKTMIHNYIDTFGKKHKGNEYAEITKDMGGGDIQIILNTVALVIYEQSLNKIYNQVESSYWTTFVRGSERISADRKDIVLTGGGEFLLLDLVFFVKLSYYKDQNYDDEAQIILRQSQNLYSKVLIKVVHISEQLNDDKITFRFQIHPVHLNQYV